MRLVWINPQAGGLLGERICYKIVDAKKIFFDTLGIKQINEACEKLRIDFLSALDEDRILNLSFSKDTIVDELNLPFTLIEPKVIEVEFYMELSKDGICMEVLPIDIEYGIYRIHVYLNAFREQDGEYFWGQQVYSRITSEDGVYFISSLKLFTVETSVFHEFLHTCSEAPWFCRKDGIIRPNLIALNAILNLIEEK